MISDAADIHDDLRGKRFRKRAAQVVDHARSGSRALGVRARKNPAIWLLIALFVQIALSGSLRAAGDWFLLPEPKFMGHQVSQPIPGSKATVLATAQSTSIGIEFARADLWRGLGLSDEAVLGVTRKLASEWLKQLKPELVRNKQKVVQYARLQSDSIPVAATVLAPEFWRQFEETFGPKMRVVIPNRQTVFVFPDLESDLDQYSRMVIEAWRSRWPKVSLEVFELSEKGLRAMGSFEEP